MFFRFFAFPGTVTGSPFKFHTNRVISFDVIEKFDDVGEFSLTLPYEKEILSAMEINDIITDGSSWLLVDTIKDNGNRIIVSGTDLNGLLKLRLSEVGESGFDAVSGTTGWCVRHYFSNNISPATAARALPVSWSGGTDQGISLDHYMAKLEPVSDIVHTLCSDAGIGYRIAGHVGTGGSLFLDMRLLTGTDRSVNQSVNEKVVFSAAHGNILSAEFTHSVSDLKNVAYVTDSNGTIVTVSREAGEGINRRETAVSVDVAATDDEFHALALKQFEEAVDKHNYCVGAAVSSGYGTRYSLGDIVTVYDIHTGNYYSDRVLEMSGHYSAGERSMNLTLGKNKLKILDRVIDNKISRQLRKRR